MLENATTIWSAGNKGIISNKIKGSKGIQVTRKTTGRSFIWNSPRASPRKVYGIVSIEAKCRCASWPEGHAGQSHGKNFRIAVGVRSGCILTIESLEIIESIVERER